MLLLRTLPGLYLFLLSCACFAQGKPVYEFWKDDPALKKKYYDHTLVQKEKFIAASDKKYEKDYKAIYESQFEGIGYLWLSPRTVTAKEANDYLQSIVQKIITANPVLFGTDARIVFTRDGWPNAASMGDGTIVVNAGLVIYMKNEAELAFAICHELAHYYLDHSNKNIRSLVEQYNSEAFRNEIKRLSKEEYRVGQQLENLLKKMAFGSHRHSREYEAEADRQAFVFMKNTGYDCNGIETCLQMLKQVDDTLLYQPFVPEATFDFEAYPFKKKWTQKTSAIFGQMTADDSPLTQQEKDSLRTHPDCDVRIQLLKDSIRSVREGKTFLVNEVFFRELKTQMFPEITEQEFRNDNLAGNLYNSLLMLQNGEHLPLAVFSIARDLNILYDRQKNHTLGDIDKESRHYPADYNLLLRMVDRWRLEEIAAVNYYFCKKYEPQMQGYDDFDREMKKAMKAMLNH